MSEPRDEQAEPRDEQAEQAYETWLIAEHEIQVPQIPTVTVWNGVVRTDKSFTELMLELLSSEEGKEF